MGIGRLEYKHVCYHDRYNPELLSKAVEEAFNVFLNRKRGINGSEFCYNEDHQMTIRDLRELNTYINKIWADEEIYIITDEFDPYWTDSGFGNEV